MPTLTACSQGFADVDGNLLNGCEVNLMTSLLHCGAVGNAVNIPNATGACAGGVPVLVSCDPGWFNVNGSLVDGCEFREDAFEPNDSSAAARFLAWGSMITANVAPQGDEDWFRYNASCTFFDTCSPAFTFSGSGTMAVFEDGIQVGSGAVVQLSPGRRITPTPSASRGRTAAPTASTRTRARAGRRFGAAPCPTWQARSSRRSVAATVLAHGGHETVPTARGASSQIGGCDEREVDGRWIGFAGLLMLIIGFIDIFQGLIAFEDEYFVVTRAGFLAVDLTAWGWVMIIWGVLLAGAASAWARRAVVGALVRDRRRVAERLCAARLSRQQPVSALGADRIDTEHRRALRADS